MTDVRCIAKILYRTYGRIEIAAGDPDFADPLACLACDRGMDWGYGECTCSQPGWVVGIYERKVGLRNG